MGQSGDGDNGGDGDSGDGDSGDGDGDGGDGDAGVVGGDGDGVGGDGDGDGGDGDGGGGLPQDGSLTTPCLSGADCQMGLGCYGAQPAAPPFNPTSRVGYCAQTCANDKDCDDLGGVVTLCSNNSGLCRVDCTAGGTDGTCPDGFECDGGRCLPPEDAAATKVQWDECDPSAIECSGGIECIAQSEIGVMGLDPGMVLDPKSFCSTVCAEDADCADDGGAGGTANCVSAGALGFSGVCAIECENDRHCPGDMVCRPTGPLSPSICAY